MQIRAVISDAAACLPTVICFSDRHPPFSAEARNGIYDEYSEGMESGRAVPIKGVSEFLAFLKESDILSAVAAGSTVRHYERIQQNTAVSDRKIRSLEEIKAYIEEENR